MPIDIVFTLLVKTAVMLALFEHGDVFMGIQRLASTNHMTFLSHRLATLDTGLETGMTAVRKFIPLSSP
jgi:hypothetical protein